ncbi:MAG: Mbeg1-like protein [Coriobacteriales bacterium]|jgi:hypothetical protein
MRRDISIIGYARSEKRTFAERPLCHADLLVMSMLSFLRFERIGQGEVLWAEGPEGIALSALNERVMLSDLAQDVLSEPKVRELAAAASVSKRFGELELLDFSARRDLEAPVAFAACAFGVPARDGRTIVIAFRGTEEEQECWQEDFECAVCTEIPSEREAIAFFNRCAHAHPGSRFVLTGFSKGGSLAERVVLFGEDAAVARIDEVVNFDGNGLFRLGSADCPEFVDFDADLSARYASCSVPLVKYLTPAFVGLILEQRDEVQLRVLRGAEGAFGHDPFFPEISRGDFSTRSLEPEERKRATLLNRWVKQLSLEERHAVIDVLFALDSESTKRFILDDWHALVDVAASTLRGMGSTSSQSRRLFFQAIAKFPGSR